MNGANAAMSVSGRNRAPLASRTPIPASRRQAMVSRRIAELAISGAGSRPGCPFRSLAPTKSKPTAAASLTICVGESSGTV
jgi:hypothetical protein